MNIIIYRDRATKETCTWDLVSIVGKVHTKRVTIIRFNTSIQAYKK